MIHGYNDETKEKVEVLAAEEAATELEVRNLYTDVLERLNDKSDVTHNHDDVYVKGGAQEGTLRISANVTDDNPYRVLFSTSGTIKFQHKVNGEWVNFWEK